MRYLIGVPTLNGPDRLQRCLSAVFAHTDLSDAVVLVADDGSSAQCLEANRSVVDRYGVEMLMSGRLGVAAQWNRLVRHVGADVPVLVNDDVEVVPDWLDVLVFSVEENLHAGMVSLNCRVGGVKPPVEPFLPLDYHEACLMSGGGRLLSAGGACFAFRREAFEQVGGFDERFFLFYEEVDFGCSLRQAGYYHYIASYPNPYHLVGATTSTLDAHVYLRESRMKFREKWGGMPDEVRARFARDSAPAPACVEWNSQMKFLRD